MNKTLIPKVSVIIPCFNHGRYIDTAVDSILGQTFQDFEIIIINDGSTDAYTINKLISYQKPRTSIINIHHTGVSTARNVGIKKAKGTYILTLDADDYFLPSFLEKAVNILNKNKKVGVVTCIMQAFGKYHWKWYPQGGGVTDFLVENNCIGNALFRKRCWEDAGGYNANMEKGYEDWDFWIGVTENNWKVYSIKETLFFYRTQKVSRGFLADKFYSKLIKQIVINHITVYKKNMIEVIYKKDKMMENVLNSESFKIATFIASVVRKLRGEMLGER